jgi:hypothetical protein
VRFKSIPSRRLSHNSSTSCMLVSLARIRDYYCFLVKKRARRGDPVSQNPDMRALLRAFSDRWLMKKKNATWGKTVEGSSQIESGTRDEKRRRK